LSHTIVNIGFTCKLTDSSLFSLLTLVCFIYLGITDYDQFSPYPFISVESTRSTRMFSLCLCVNSGSCPPRV